MNDKQFILFYFVLFGMILTLFLIALNLNSLTYQNYNEDVLPLTANLVDVRIHGEVSGINASLKNSPPYHWSDLIILIPFGILILIIALGLLVIIRRLNKKWENKK